MKIRSFFVSMLAIAALASCSNNEEYENLVPGQTSDNAYLALTVSMPQGATRADGGPGTGTTVGQEGALSSIYVVGLNNENIRGVYEITKTPKAAFKVASDINNVFVVANPSAKMLAQMKAAASYSALNLAISEGVASVTTGVTGFMMTSAGANPNDKGLTGVTVVTANSESQSDIDKAIAAAAAKPATVNIDRIMSKVTLSNNAPTVENGTVAIKGWLLNTTNKSYFPYAELIDYAIPTGLAPAKYRVDTNWDILDVAIAKKTFNWLHNYENIDRTWGGQPSSAYCLENTMGAPAQVNSNTTKMVVKATYTPNTIQTTEADPTPSWFRMGGIVYTLAELQAIYGDPITAVATKTAMDAFYTKLTGKTVPTPEPTNFTSTCFGDVTLAELDAVENGGYIAATIEGYLIEYFQKSVCYYDVLIKHDNRVQPKLLGRWGVVRNNDYTVNITKISKPGLPYIPDPTDPDIKDPQNPGPDKPNDETSAFIAVNIVVNPWTSWSQDNEL